MLDTSGDSPDGFVRLVLRKLVSGTIQDQDPIFNNGKRFETLYAIRLITRHSLSEPSTSEASECIKNRQVASACLDQEVAFVDPLSISLSILFVNTFSTIQECISERVPGAEVDSYSNIEASDVKLRSNQKTRIRSHMTTNKIVSSADPGMDENNRRYGHQVLELLQVKFNGANSSPTDSELAKTRKISQTLLHVRTLIKNDYVTTAAGFCSQAEIFFKFPPTTCFSCSGASGSPIRSENDQNCVMRVFEELTYCNSCSAIHLSQTSWTEEKNKICDLRHVRIFRIQYRPLTTDKTKTSGFT
ncbi:hypothetical protein T265_05665 [Opisthorchis viverrini]|uniref:Uncharacterized protein n=1 Tax=Opisthorchis viverrini TaxID=6198 RepID=A0A075AF10_OPIVI|nr:hypothetical protein T265_05665 [Opisthorchis viverrini]KER27259.1 hypothetical protein T265_05665 [Opisthorchis viverrini]